MAVVVIVAYDVASDRRRNRLAKYLQGWGYRIQESVFQLRLGAADLAEVREHVFGIINDTQDVVHIYPLCASCQERSEVYGTAAALDDVGLYRGLW
ncbi:CRISPR-associated endonuclease Cas2 [Actinomyces sp.]|uniref:CRISPR-associated endonuclease Cas2 n=1 Tax=Actinomyces sp. TaxID=29317 RepID=UPI0026DDC3AD|nr:CRISPR-associated endonuclease Cas2 [Actinomyces sp.]MDO4900523.1 CRISPR-associated endonuclease Cas2 [Actinomyces sp.]